MQREPVIVELRDVTVDFAGLRVLAGVSCTIAGQGVCGLIGTNGAGKTTLIHAAVGLREVNSGEVVVQGDPEAVAYCPDTPNFDPYLTAAEVLQESARLGAPARRRRLEPETLLDEVGLAEAGHRRVGGFSRGMLQRLGIAAALSRDPAVLILDEPTSALDPLGREAVLSLIAQLGTRMMVVFSSHVLEDVDRVATHLLVLNRGNHVYAGERAGFGGTAPSDTLTLELAHGIAALTEELDRAGLSWQQGSGPRQVVVGAAALPLLLERIGREPGSLVELARRDSLLTEFIKRIAA